MREDDGTKDAPQLEEIHKTYVYVKVFQRKDLDRRFLLADEAQDLNIAAVPLHRPDLKKKQNGAVEISHIRSQIYEPTTGCLLTVVFFP